MSAILLPHMRHVIPKELADRCVEKRKRGNSVASRLFCEAQRSQRSTPSATVKEIFKFVKLRS